MSDNWIQGAIKKPGALRNQLGVKKGDKIPEKKLDRVSRKLEKKAKGAKKLTKNELKLSRRVSLAKTLKKMRRKR